MLLPGVILCTSTLLGSKIMNIMWSAKSLMFMIVATLICISTAVLQDPCQQTSKEITEYVVPLNAEGTDYFCQTCTVCSSYKRYCTLYSDAICKEPVEVAFDFILVISVYSTVSIAVFIYSLIHYFEKHPKSK